MNYFNNFLTGLPLLTLSPKTRPSSFTYILHTSPDSTSKDTSDDLTFSLQNSKCKSLPSEKSPHSLCMFLRFSGMWFQILQVWFPWMLHPPENACAYQSLRWPHSLVSLRLLILSHVSVVHVGTSPSIRLLTPQRTFPTSYFTERSESRGRGLFKK